MSQRDIHFGNTKDPLQFEIDKVRSASTMEESKPVKSKFKL